MSCPKPGVNETRSSQTCLPMPVAHEDDLVRFYLMALLRVSSDHFSNLDSAVQLARGFFPEAREDSLRSAAQTAFALGFA